MTTERARPEKDHSRLNPIKKYFETGRFFTRLSEEYNADRATLPLDYNYAIHSRITLEEVARLWGARAEGFFQERNRWRRLNLTVYDIGVRNRSERLVGFGALVVMQDHGEMCDFIVEEPHRSRGIGRAIIDERLRIASHEGVESMYIPRLACTNTLGSYYIEQGFFELSDGALGAGPDPEKIIPV